MYALPNFGRDRAVAEAAFVVVAGAEAAFVVVAAAEAGSWVVTDSGRAHAAPADAPAAADDGWTCERAGCTTTMGGVYIADLQRGVAQPPRQPGERTTTGGATANNGDTSPRDGTAGAASGAGVEQPPTRSHKSAIVDADPRAQPRRPDRGPPARPT